MKQPLRLIPHWRNIWRFIRDPKSDWKPKALVVLAMLYLLWPLDLAPDLIPVFGWLDDIGLNGLAAWYLVHATNTYLESQQDKKSSS
jgi:uncharacterized membrane protein YkvA (DUF1232 family)